MKLTSTLLVSLFAMATAATAQQFEATIDYAHTDTDVTGGISSSSNTDRTLFGFTYYFTPLDSAEGPLALSSFFGRNSSVSASYAVGDVDSFGVETDLDAYSLFGRYVHADSGWLVDAAFARTDVDTSPNTRSDTYSIAVGKYFAPTSTISLGFSRTDDDANGDSSRVTLSNFHAQALGNGSYFDGGAELSYVDTDDAGDGYELVLATTYYPNRALGVGLFGGYADIGSTDSFAYGVSAEYFFTESFAVNARYTATDSDAGFFDVDTDTFSIGARVRF